MFQRRDDLESLRRILAAVAVLVRPVGASKRDRHRAGDKAAGDVEAEDILVGLVDAAVAVVVDLVVGRGQTGRRAGDKGGRAQPAAGERELAQAIGERCFVKRAAAGAGEAHVDPRAVGRDIEVLVRQARDRRGRAGRVQRVQ